MLFFFFSVLPSCVTKIFDTLGLGLGVEGNAQCQVVIHCTWAVAVMAVA